jgi:hypothetical protein
MAALDRASGSHLPMINAARVQATATASPQLMKRISILIPLSD